MAGVAQSHIPFRFAWQAWRNLTSAVLLHGRRRATHTPSFCKAAVAQSHIRHRFAWHACRSWDWVARLAPVSSQMTPVLCLAGEAHSHIHGRFVWQAWRNLTSAVVFSWQAWRNLRSAFFCVPGVPLMGWAARLGLFGRRRRRGTSRQAWHNLTSTFVFHGKRGAISHPLSFFRGRCGTHGTGWRAWAGLIADDAATLCRTHLHSPSFCVESVAQSHICLRSVWQACHSRDSVARWYHILSAIWLDYDRQRERKERNGTPNKRKRELPMNATKYELF